MSPNYSMEDSARVREFQQFLDGAIHGIRGPLRGIGTSAALLSQKWNDGLDEEGRGLVRSILDGVTTLNNLTKSMSDYSTTMVHHGRMVLLPIENAVRNALATLHARIEENGADIYCGPLPRLVADHDQLSLLFRCLLSNALAFRRLDTAPRIEITATEAGNQWRFAVSDNGAGVAARYHRQVFEAFARLQAEPAGFGLGLAISKQIVTGHGGRLWIDSREGEGSTFYFTLPADLPA